MSRCCDAAVPVLTLRTCLGPGSEAAGQLARESSLHTVTAQVSTQKKIARKRIGEMLSIFHKYLRKVCMTDDWSQPRYHIQKRFLNG